jgi:hypothetical protein
MQASGLGNDGKRRAVINRTLVSTLVYTALNDCRPYTFVAIPHAAFFLTGSKPLENEHDVYVSSVEHRTDGQTDTASTAP